MALRKAQAIPIVSLVRYKPRLGVCTIPTSFVEPTESFSDPSQL